MFINILFIWLYHCLMFAQAKNIHDIRADIEKYYELDNIRFSEDIYERLVYFGKASCLSSCIDNDGLKPGKRLNKGACPRHIKFCYEDDINPTADRTRITMVIEAQKNQLGSGFIMVDYAKEVIIMVFRSSTTSQDWFSDFNILPTNYEPASEKQYRRLIKKGVINECKNCKIHRGFNKFTESLSEAFLDEIETILQNFPDFQMVITGHSLGGALASIAGIELKLRGFHPMVLMYATPKIFNYDMKEWVNEIFDVETIHDNIMNTGEIEFSSGYFRVVHQGDYIPKIPPFYHSAGLEIFINKKELPHRRKDLLYKGPYDMDINQLGLRDRMSELVNKWLHTYEHRAYFNLFKGCYGF